MNIHPKFHIIDDDPELLWKFTAYMEQVVKHARIDYLRRQKHQNHETALDPSYEELLYYEDQIPSSKHEFDFLEDKLATAFSCLNLLRQQILTLIFVEGFSAMEAAEKLGCTVNYVYLQKHRALKSLRDQLMDGGCNCGE